MRDSDQQFFDTFMLVIGILMGVGVGIFYMARWVAGETQSVYIREDAAVLAAVEERIEPVGRVFLMGDEELAAALAAKPTPVATVLSGPQVYNAACTACHQTGLAGAPRMGDAGLWAPRIAKGMETLERNAIQGFTSGPGSIMPPKGGRVDLSDAEIIDAVHFMVEGSR